MLWTQKQGGSFKDRASREAQKDQRMKDNWQEEQRNRRRVWTNGTENDFRNEINERLEDKEGLESTRLPIKTKDGKQRWLPT